MLVCLLLISCITLLSLRSARVSRPEHYYFLNGYMLKQSEAIRERKRLAYDSGIVFSPMGHINMARTIHFEKKTATFNLGSGYVLLR